MTDVSVATVDPATGAAADWADFPTGKKSSSNNGNPSVTIRPGVPLPDAGILGNLVDPTDLVKRMFSPDFKLITAKMANPSDSELNDVGWENTSGRFTDVSQYLYSPGAFATVPEFNGAQFSQDGNFYFTQTADGQPSVFFKVAAHGDAPVKLSDSGTDTAPKFWVMNRNGNLTAYDGGGNFLVTEFATPGWDLQANDRTWVSATSFLEVDNDRLYYVTLTGPPVLGFTMDDSTEHPTPITPDISGWKIWSAVPSPDGSAAAFLAQSSTGQVGIYTVPITGGTPAKVQDNGSTNLTVDSMLAGWY
jgi:hypothetical protein